MINRFIVSLVRVYQRFLSPLFPGHCRFYPSCSQYTVQCFEEYGFFKACGKSIFRIARCNPFSQGYFDYAKPDELMSGNYQYGKQRK